MLRRKSLTTNQVSLDSMVPSLCTRLSMYYHEVRNNSKLTILHVCFSSLYLTDWHSLPMLRVRVWTGKNDIYVSVWTKKSVSFRSAPKFWVQILDEETNATKGVEQGGYETAIENLFTLGKDDGFLIRNRGSEEFLRSRVWGEWASQILFAQTTRNKQTSISGVPRDNFSMLQKSVSMLYFPFASIRESVE